MMANAGLQRLLQYGLTEYESRTYLALVAAGPSTARDLANLSRVPRTKIYGVLEDLGGKGLVQLLPERPRRFEAMAIDRYMQRFEDEIKLKLERLRADRALMAQEFPRPAMTGAQRPGGFNVVKGRRNVVGRLAEMLEAASSEVLVSGSGALPVRLLHHLPELRALASGGVRVRVLCPLEPRNEVAVGLLRGIAEIRGATLPSAGSGTVVVDAKQSLMCHFVPDDEHLFKGDDVGIWSDDPAIVQDMAHTLRQQWEQAVAVPA